MNTASRLERAQAAGFFVAGEPLAVDLADTIITSRDPVVDLLTDESTCRFWWGLQQDRLPDGAPAPSLALTIELRRAVREILDGHIAGIAPSTSSVDRVNDIVASVACTRQLVQTPAGWAALTIRHPPADRRYELALAAVAESLIDLLVGPEHNRLRRCQNPTCSMLFVASDVRRKFCTQNICANRTRVARHYHRHRPS
jgi:predicted RNA-binding Zn ribbon-like protein